VLIFSEWAFGSDIRQSLGEVKETAPVVCQLVPVDFKAKGG